MQEVVISKTSPAMYLLDILATSKESVLTLHNQLLLNVPFLSTGVVRDLVKVEGRGKKRGWMLTLKILVPNSGTDIAFTSMLSSMSFEEEWTSLTSSGGSIGTLSMWKLRDRRPF